MQLWRRPPPLSLALSRRLPYPLAGSYTPHSIHTSLTSLPPPQLLQNPDRPRGHRRAQERHPDPRRPQERRPVPQHQARQHPGARGDQVPAHGESQQSQQPPHVPPRERAQLLSLMTDRLSVLFFWQSAVKNVFIRGSVVRYVHLPANAVDIPLLEDATRRGEFGRRPELVLRVCVGGRLTHVVQRLRTRLGRGSDRWWIG